MSLAWKWSRRSSNLVAQSASAYAAGDWSEAASLARQRLKTAPDDVEAIRMLARSSARLGRDGPANALFARLGTDALRSEDLFLLGIGLARAGRGREAEQVWEKALALDPDHAGTLEQLVSLYTSQNRLIEAARIGERLSRRPGFELQGELSLALVRAELGDPAGSAQVLQRALQRPEAAHWPPSTSARYRKLLARTLLELEDPGAARSVLKEVLDTGPDLQASWLLSRSFLQQGSSSEAAAALKRAGSYRADHPLEWEPSPYAGEARCAPCHPAIFRAHHESRHSSTLLRGASLAEVAYPKGEVPDPDHPRVSHRFRKGAGRVEFQTAMGKEVHRAVVEYAFGSIDHYASFVGHDDHGRPTIMRLSRYQDGRESGWVRTTGHTSEAGGGSASLGKPLESADGLYKCLFCHSTDPLAILETSGRASADRGIGCERCHGPGRNHLAAVAAEFPDLAIANPAAASGEARMGLCGQCHGHHQESPLPRDDPFWIRFQSTTLTWSRCYTESAHALDCVTCHDPHHNAEHSVSHYESRCMSCHSADKASVRSSVASPKTASESPVPSSPAAVPGVARGAICPVNPAHGCVGCHMPLYRSRPLHASFADHYIRVHPHAKPATPATDPKPDRG